MSNTAALTRIRDDLDAIRARLVDLHGRIQRRSGSVAAAHTARAHHRLVEADVELTIALQRDPDPTIVIDVTPRAGAAA